MTSKQSIQARVLLAGWLMAAAGTGAFTSTILAPHQSSSHFRGPLRIPPHGEIRPVENLSFFSSSSNPSSFQSSSAVDKQSPQSRRASLIPLYQSSRTETIAATSTTRPHLQLLPSRSSVSIDAWLPLSSWKRCSKQVTLLAEDAQDAWERCTSAVSSLVKNFWWLFPLLSMSMVPLYTVTVFQSLPETPHFWKLVSMEHVLRDWIAPFLISNATYYMAAAHVFFSTQRQKQGNDKLALWILASGTVSTIFHTVQSLGDYRVAELFCYLDHGVAGTAILYFWHKCGAPSRRTWAFGVTGLACLAFPGQALYPALHSIWHALSALTAVVWVHDDGRQKMH